MSPVEKTSPPEIEKPVKECKVCDLMITLGLASAVCQDLPTSEQNKCHQIVKPLEERKAAAVDVLADLIVLTGDTGINEVLDRMNMILFSATAKAKEKLIAQGKLTPQGFPIETK